MRRLAAAGLTALACALSACRPSDDLGPALDTTPPAALPSRFYPPDGWAWGLIQVGEHPPHRYGVAGPRRESRGDIIILPGRAEPAEAWFETANDLILAGWTVWTLDPAGQGGSARATSPRDLLHITDGSTDATALRALIELSGSRRPSKLVVLASGFSRRTAEFATTFDPPVGDFGCAGSRPTCADVVILSAPTDAFEPTGMTRYDWGLLSVVLSRIGLADRRAWSEERWSGGRATGAASGDSERVSASAEWMRANPDLRTGGASWGWHAAIWEEASRRGLGPNPVGQAPVVVIAPPSIEAGSARDCQYSDNCTLIPLSGSGPAPHLETDGIRNRWLAVVLAAADGRPLPPAAPAG